MVISLVALLLITAFVVTIVHAVGKAPLWPAVLLLIVIGLMGALR